MRMHIATNEVGKSFEGRSITCDELTHEKDREVFGEGEEAANREALFVGGVLPKGCRVPTDEEKEADYPPDGAMAWSTMMDEWVPCGMSWTESSIVPKDWKPEPEIGRCRMCGGEVNDISDADLGDQIVGRFRCSDCAALITFLADDTKEAIKTFNKYYAEGSE